MGVKGRNRTDGILLIETKHAIGSVDSQIKATIEHKEYGKALMIHWRDRKDWMTVRYDSEKGKNELDAMFRLKSLPSY